MKIDDLITEAPLGFGDKITKGLKSLVPGSTGQRAKGELQTGKVANIWKKEFMNYVGRSGISKYGDTRSLIAFLKAKQFTPAQMKMVLKGTPIKESSLMYERNLGPREIDRLMLRAAKVAAASEFDPKGTIPDDPSPTAPRAPGAIDKAVDIGKQVAPHVAKAASAVGQKASDVGKKLFTKKAQPQQQAEPDLRKDQYGRIEPTMGTPVPRTMPNLVKQKATMPKFEPARQAPKMKMKPVTRYK